MTRAGVLALLLVVAAAVVAEEAAETPPREGLTAALARVGRTPADLRLDLPADWLGQPPVAAVPFVLPHVAAVYDDPRRLGLLGWNLLHVARLAGDAESALPVLSAFLLQPRHPAGFRGVDPPAIDPAPGPGALTAALARLRAPAATDVESELPAVARWPGHLPPPGAEERALPAPLRAPLARLLLALARAAEDVERSWATVPTPVVAAALAARDVPRLLPGGEVAWPALARAASASGDVTRAAAAVAVLRATERAARELADLDLEVDGLAWQVVTPRGRVVVTGDGDHEHACAGDCLLVVDLAGDDTYRGDVATARFPAVPVAVVLDLAGDDRYEARTSDAAQGAGLGGVGLLLDAEGDDAYTAGDRAQGYGVLGYGLLVDRAGSDQYRARGGAQGAAVFGGGLLVDLEGGDVYELAGEGQGFAGPGAAGALVDAAGDDVYRAEPDPARAPGREDHHSRDRVNASNAQGAGVGRRGDLTDGVAWAGGVGVLADATGDDRYVAGNFAQGTGYFYGTGMLLDGGGRDTTESVYFAQASASHGGIALLLDDGGDDRRLLAGEAGAALGYVWDAALALLLDTAGNDLYRARRRVLGAADLGSIALAFDLAGDDRYEVESPALAFGWTDDARRVEPGGPLRAAGVAGNVGLFLDLGGTDVYPPGLVLGGDDAAPGAGGRGGDVDAGVAPLPLWLVD